MNREGHLRDRQLGEQCVRKQLLLLRICHGQQVRSVGSEVHWDQCDLQPPGALRDQHVRARLWPPVHEPARAVLQRDRQGRAVRHAA